jgi:hypothetical protein
VEDVLYAVKKIKQSRVDVLPSKDVSFPSIPPMMTVQTFQQPGTTANTMKEHQVEEISEDEIVLEEKQESTGVTNGNPDENPIFAALLFACRQAGYDSSHEKRVELEKPENVQSGSDFPADILTIVMEKTLETDKNKVQKVLRPQLHIVLEGMKNAVKAEEELREELRTLDEKKRLQKIMEIEKKQERLRLAGKCCMGFTWHRCGQGWRCAGGSHYVSDLQLDTLA